MKWKVGLLGLILLISLALAFTPGPSKQETKYWDTTNAPTGAVIPIVEQSTPFNVTITDWDTSSLKGKATIQFPVYSKADLASCLIESKVEHLSYFSDKPKLWGSYKGTCTKTSKTVNIPGVGDAKVVECPNVVVGDGVNYINVTCENVAGQASSASTKFIIDKMKPYVDPDSITVENWGPATEEKPANLAPKVSFKVEDISGLSVCTVETKMYLKDKEGPVPYLFECYISPETTTFDEIKTFTVICEPIGGNPLPVEFIRFGPGSASINCTDKVGNTITSQDDKRLKFDIGGYSIFLSDLPDIIYKMAKMSRKYTPKEDVEKAGFYTLGGGDSPELDSNGIATFVYIPGEKGWSRGDMKKYIVNALDNRMANDNSMKIPRLSCTGSVATCATIDAIVLALTLPSGGASQVAKEEAQQETKRGVVRWFKNGFRRVGEGFKNFWRVIKRGRPAVKAFVTHPWGYVITAGVLSVIRTGLRTSSALANAPYETYYLDHFDMTKVNKDPITEDKMWGWAFAEAAIGLLPFGQTFLLAKDTVTADTPNINLYAPSKIEVNRTYWIIVKTERVDLAGYLHPTGNDIADQILQAIVGCFTGCPNYVTTVVIIPANDEEVEVESSSS